MAETHTGQIDQLQQDVVDRLGTDSILKTLEILYEKTKEIESTIAIALGPAKGGICIVVTPPVCTVDRPNMPGPYFDGVTLDINAVENVTINQGTSGTKYTAAYVAELAAKCIHRHVTRDKRCLLAVAVRPVADPVYRVYRVQIKTAFGLA